MLKKFVPVLMVKSKEVKWLKKTEKKGKRCGAKKHHFCHLCHYKSN